MIDKTFALFAANEVGLKTAELLVHDPALKLIVVSLSDLPHYQDRIISLATVSKVPHVLYDSKPSSDCTQALMKLAPDYFLLAWWPHRLSTHELNMAKAGVLNFHPGYLPWCRGKHGSFWSILDGEPFGVTIHWAIDRLDAGDIAFQRRIPVAMHQTGQELYELSKQAMLELFGEVWSRIRVGDIPRLPNYLEKGTYHDAVDIEEASRLDLDGVYSGRRLLNLLRARTFPGHPGAWFLDENGQRYEVRVEIKAQPLP